MLGANMSPDDPSCAGGDPATTAMFRERYAEYKTNKAGVGAYFYLQVDDVDAYHDKGRDEGLEGLRQADVAVLRDPRLLGGRPGRLPADVLHVDQDELVPVVRHAPHGRGPRRHVLPVLHRREGQAPPGGRSSRERPRATSWACRRWRARRPRRRRRSTSGRCPPGRASTVHARPARIPGAGDPARPAVPGPGVRNVTEDGITCGGN